MYIDVPGLQDVLHFIATARFRIHTLSPADNTSQFFHNHDLFHQTLLVDMVMLNLPNFTNVRD